ncbi:hypothetical protein N7468_008470 [Penicillium chermesinum]|uniref:Uncharacterized protein n=1 Tax=Penicillium chermesinum TaxID=63820 RepID=A0A9W9NS33_9EURO|nr:uncharacterized protein N7468_008470 [Penicillium chermesinum]KAJ5223928.1 hypothetical protein N7468_008470 [Penicillium chermesinum]KAJ6155250.1 hypothetical protein N7470_005816 [Penicillium chermesinum]
MTSLPPHDSAESPGWFWKHWKPKTSPLANLTTILRILPLRGRAGHPDAPAAPCAQSPTRRFGALLVKHQNESGSDLPRNFLKKGGSPCVGIDRALSTASRNHERRIKEYQLEKPPAQPTAILRRNEDLIDINLLDRRV